MAAQAQPKVNKYISKASFKVGMWVSSLEVHFQSMSLWARSSRSSSSWAAGRQRSECPACSSDIRNYDLKRSF